VFWVMSVYLNIKNTLPKSGTPCVCVYIYTYIYTHTHTHRTVIFPYVLYGCKTWSRTLREECRLRVLRKVLGSRRDEMTGE